MRAAPIQGARGASQPALGPGIPHVMVRANGSDGGLPFDAAARGMPPAVPVRGHKPGTGRTVQLHPQEALLQQARDPAFSDGAVSAGPGTVSLLRPHQYPGTWRPRWPTWVVATKAGMTGGIPGDSIPGLTDANPSPNKGPSRVSRGELIRPKQAAAPTPPRPSCRPRSLDGKPLAGFCATRSRRIQDLYGMVVHVIRCNTHYAIDNRR